MMLDLVLQCGLIGPILFLFFNPFGSPDLTAPKQVINAHRMRCPNGIMGKLNEFGTGHIRTVGTTLQVLCFGALDYRTMIRVPFPRTFPAPAPASMAFAGDLIGTCTTV